ncbi:MAG TPA: hypothetical protein VEC16_03135 [Alphaproteobacteria bacterium]|nr:hypothetical protein [Alphaproteobacteria bacterium]
MAGIKIKTGADKLIELVSERKKISIEDAAKSLGVGKTVVQEWAEFLEEEGIISLEYSLSKTWITEKKITKEDIVRSANEVYSEKDALARKIDVAITTLQKDTSGFEDIKKEFENIQKNIKNEIELVKRQLSDLEKFDNLRKNLDKDITKQKSEYQDFVSQAQEKIKAESQKYDELRSIIEKERKNIDQSIQKIEDLKKLKTEYERTISSLRDSLKNIDNTLADQKKKFDTSSKNLQNYRESIDDLDKEISQKKNTLLNKKLEELKTIQDKLLKNQSGIETDLKQKMSSMKNYAGLNGKLGAAFSGAIAKNISTEKLIAEIENDKTSLAKDLEALKTKVEKFTLISSHSNMKTGFKDLENTLKELEKKKGGIRAKIERLVSMIKG